MFEFNGRTVLVSGGGRGIGDATCRMLAAAGANVLVADINDIGAKGVVDAIEEAGGTASAITLDVTDFGQCNDVIDDAVATYGKLDALILCAGWAETHPFLTEAPEYWQRVVDVNLFGTIYPCHAALRHMTAAGYGRIVTVASDAGRVGTLGETVYAGAKAGVIGFTKSLAREAGRAGVTANCVSPGVTDTPLMRHQDQTVIDKMIRLVTLKRVGLPEEVAAALAFFASDEAAFITGQVISVSGGLTMVG